MSKIRNITYTLLLLLVASAARAQVSIEAKLDSMRIPFGGQTTLRVRVSAPKGTAIQMPHLKAGQQLTADVMVVEASKTSSRTAGDSAIAELSVPITSFTAKRYTLPGLKLKAGGKEFTANQLILQVDSVVLDKKNPEKTFPPKDIQNNPFSWADWWLPLLLLVVVALLVVALVVSVRRLRSHKPLVKVVKEVKVVPAHLKAMERIAQLKQEMPTDSKEYYTSLTETLRQYITERFGFNAMEMTSDQIIDKLNSESDKAKTDELVEVFRTADLAKFAKYSTPGSENSYNLESVVKFIDNTKPDETVQVVKKVAEPTAVEQAEKRSRRLFKVAVAVLSVLIVAAVIWLVLLVWPLLADL